MYYILAAIIGFLIGGFITGLIFTMIMKYERVYGTIEVSSNPDKDFYTLHVDSLDDLEIKDKVIFKIIRS